MKTSKIVLTSLILVILLSGCTNLKVSSPIESKENIQTVLYASDYNSFISALREKGYIVEEPLELQPSPNDNLLLSVHPRVIKIDSENISIFEFIDSETAKSQAQTISSDGSHIGYSMIDWVEPPHFYLQGRIIIGYVGRNKNLLNGLKDIIGAPITSN